MVKRFLPLILLLSALGMAGPVQVLAETQEFSEPMMGRYRLNFCRYDHQGDCGIGAALEWCRQQGFQMADGYLEDLGQVSPTIRVGDRRVCRTQNCRGFEVIVCSRDHAPRSVRPEEQRPTLPERPDFGEPAETSDEEN